MLNRIESNGMLENTLVIATSDNAMPFPRFKGDHYEYATRMPMAIMWKGKIASPGRRTNALISFIDLAPTLLEAAHVAEANAGMQLIEGSSFFDVLHNKRQVLLSSTGEDVSFVITGRERNADFRAQHEGYPVRSIIRGSYSYIYNFKPHLWPNGGKTKQKGNMPHGEVSRSPTKDVTAAQPSLSNEFLLIYGKRPTEELFNVNADPESKLNLAENATYAALKADLKAQLFAQLVRQNDPRALGNGEVFDSYERAPDTLR